MDTLVLLLAIVAIVVIALVVVWAWLRAKNLKASLDYEAYARDIGFRKRE